MFSNFFAYWYIKYNNILVKLYIVVKRINRSNNIIKLIKRILCVALIKLYKKNIDINNVMSRVYNSKDLHNRKQNNI